MPLTSRKDGRSIYPNEAVLEANKYGLPNESVVLCYQIRTLDKQRLSSLYGEITEKEKQEEGYLTDLLSQRAVDYVQRMAPGAAQGTPFFLSLHYTAPHWPWETREDHALAQEVKSNLFHLDGGNIHTYHRMIHHMDEGIGWVVDTLKKSCVSSKKMYSRILAIAL